MTVNAQYILDNLTAVGWSKESVCAMLGNMQTESTINPGIWQDLAEGRLDLGYGLVQWTPASKYIEWANSNGYALGNMEGQFARLQWEIDNNQQWIPTDAYPMSFSAFKTSALTPEYLAQAFLRNYERPSNQNQPNRSTQARYWYDTLTEGQPCLQLAKFPMDRIQITQGENGSYSHRGTYCIDFVGTHDKYPYYAPCDCECVAAFNDVAVWKSLHPVMCADGQVREIFWDCIHEVPLSHGVGTMLIKGELMGHTGVGGTATGDHLHMQVMEGNTYLGFTTNEYGSSTLIGTELHIYDVFAVNDVTIVNGLGYPWTVSDYVDCSEPEPPNPPNPPSSSKNLIGLLLCDALNGWKLIKEKREIFDYA